MNLDREWNTLLESIEENKECIINEEFSDYLFEYLVTGEDHRFWLHPGVDPISLIRAVWRTTICKRREGGSTVAMQLVRTLTNNYEMSLSRKTREIYYALKITSFLDRKMILGLYLSVAYYGWNMHGIKQACLRLGLDHKNLTEHQAASLVARLKYPEPKVDSLEKRRKILLRTSHILNRYNKLTSRASYGTI